MTVVPPQECPWVKLLTSKPSVQSIHGKIVLSSLKYPTKVWEHWEKDLDTEGIGLKWDRIEKFTRGTFQRKLISFNIRFANRTYKHNGQLYHCGFKTDKKCSFCEEEDSYIHRFWSCPKIQVLWQQLINLCKSQIDATLDYSPVNCLLLGFTNVQVCSLMLMMKYYIHVNHFPNRKLEWLGFKGLYIQTRARHVLTAKYISHLKQYKVMQNWYEMPL